MNLLLLAFLGGVLAATSSPTVKTTNGTVIGVTNSFYNQEFFLGIPYAQAPLQNLRFTVPKPYNKKYSKFDASHYSPLCVGYGGDDIGYTTSEDCLTLNVIRPVLETSPENLKLPVLVWIHGGGFVMGGSGDHRYNLTFLVNLSVKNKQPFIGVSINYRLGPWGFLAGRQIIGSGNTNIGLKDQRLALHWIQDNIAAFGGDPDRVTIWGESAGALSIGAQLIAYGGRDDKLFRAAIMDSGGPISAGPLSFGDQPQYDVLVSETGCISQPDSLQCLRELDFTTLNKVLNTTLFNSSASPIVDGDFIPEYPSRLVNSGKFVRVPIIIGSNSDEGTAFGPRGINTTQEFASYLQKLTSPFSTYNLSTNIVSNILKYYPDVPSLGIPVETGNERYASNGYEYKRTSAFAGDYIFIAPQRLVVNVWSKFSVPSYSYRFNTIPHGLPRFIGATHFQEVAFVFQNFDGLGYAVNPFEGEPKSYQDLARYMGNKWVSFINYLDPNIGVARVSPKWPAYSNGQMNVVFDANKTSYVEKDSYRKEGIAYINSNLLQFSR